MIAIPASLCSDFIHIALESTIHITGIAKRRAGLEKTIAGADLTVTQGKDADDGEGRANRVFFVR
jgi:hypothetical protein